MIKRVNIILLIMGIVFLFGFYGWFIPNKIKEDSPKIIDMLDDKYNNPKLIDISGIKQTAYFNIKTKNNKDSTVSVYLNKGSYIIIY